MNRVVPTVARPPRTPLFHMTAHVMAVPECEPLDAELYQIGVYGVGGQQHNPCVFLLDGKLHVNVRVLPTTHPGSFSTNYIARVEDDWTLTHARELKPKGTSVVRGPIRTPLAMNFPKTEDLRVFSWRGGLYAIACTHDGGNPPGWIRQALLELTPDAKEIVEARIIQSDRHEKNWMPCVNGSELLLVYSVEPLIVIQAEGTNIPSAGGVPQAMGTVRGGTQLVEHAGGWLSLVHQVFRPPRIAPGYNPLLGGWEPPIVDPIAGDAPTVYLHYFAKFSKDLGSVELSKPFFFKKPGIEFAAGLVPRGDGGGFIASFGVADREAWLARFDMAAVERLFTKAEA